LVFEAGVAQPHEQFDHGHGLSGVPKRKRPARSGPLSRKRGAYFLAGAFAALPSPLAAAGLTAVFASAAGAAAAGAAVAAGSAPTAATSAASSPPTTTTDTSTGFGLPRVTAVTPLGSV